MSAPWVLWASNALRSFATAAPILALVSVSAPFWPGTLMDGVVRVGALQLAIAVVMFFATRRAMAEAAELRTDDPAHASLVNTANVALGLLVVALGFVFVAAFAR